MQAVGHEAPTILLLSIVTGYIVIAWQFRALHDATSRAARSLKLMIATFLLCAMSGYIPTLLARAGVDYPHWAHLATHGLLVASTWAFILTRQAEELRKALD